MNTETFRTPGGVEYEELSQPENLVMGREMVSTDTLEGTPLARVIVRLEHLVEAAEDERDQWQHLHESDREILLLQKRRIDAAEAKIDELALESAQRADESGR